MINTEGKYNHLIIKYNHPCIDTTKVFWICSVLE